MITRPNAKCSSPGCKAMAIWGQNWVPKHCEAHKLPEDNNLVERSCGSCGLTMLLNADERCEFCDPSSFKTARLAKQTALMSYLDSRGLSGASTDAVVEHGACGRERPDRVIELSDKIIVLECDEHQHRDRACECEQVRMINIGQSFGGMPVYFIRWNPDGYASSRQPEDIKRRHRLVGDLLRDILDGRHALPHGLVSAMYMYFDGWTCLADEQWRILLEHDP